MKERKNIFKLGGGISSNRKKSHVYEDIKINLVGGVGFKDKFRLTLVMREGKNP